MYALEDSFKWMSSVVIMPPRNVQMQMPTIKLIAVAQQSIAVDGSCLPKPAGMWTSQRDSLLVRISPAGCCRIPRVEIRACMIAAHRHAPAATVSDNAFKTAHEYFSQTVLFSSPLERTQQVLRVPNPQHKVE